MKAHVEAYGCTLNRGEAGETEDLLAASGWELSPSAEGCDLVVLATCVVVEKTERKMLERVEELSSARRLIVTGCVATLPMRDKVRAIVPKAEFCPPGQLNEFARLTGVKSTEAARRSRESYAIVPISTGCLGECSYCITRLARGGLRSRAPDTIKSSVERSVAGNRPREVRLTAQDTAAYGVDLETDLATLVHALCEIPHDFRLRLGMMNPRSAMRLLGTLGDIYREPKVFKFLHIPVQSGSDRILELMNRGYSVKDFGEVVRAARAAFPDLSLSTDLIVGYPGEEDIDHELDLKLISDFRPDIVNVTRFSPRPGTRAAGGGRRPPGGLVKERSREITRLRFRVALERNSAWIGKEFRALSTERGKRGTTLFRTELYQQIVVPDVLPLGRYYHVIVDGATPTYLTGAILEAA